MQLQQIFRFRLFITHTYEFELVFFKPLILPTISFICGQYCFITWVLKFFDYVKRSIKAMPISTVKLNVHID